MDGANEACRERVNQLDIRLMLPSWPRGRDIQARQDAITDRAMSLILKLAIALAAVLFIGISATMNALFLSSFGQTSVEIALLASVSLAADVVKATLPVVIARAAFLRAWGHCTAAGVMLTLVTALSVSSGAGFTALTRNAAVTSRIAQAELLAARQRDLQLVDAQIEALAPSRAVSIIEADMAASAVDRRWQASNSCSAFTTTSTRQFCAEVFKLRSELSIALVRDRLAAERSVARAKVATLSTTGVGAESDPQAAAIAALFGVDKSTPRLVLPVSVAVILELGSVILVLLLAGPTIGRWKEPEMEPDPVAHAKPATISTSPPLNGDIVGWQLKKNRTTLTSERGGSNAR